MILDKYAKEIFDKNINMTVPWYLMASYAYYKEDNPILTDSFYDELANFMLKNWNKISHRHKKYITTSDLQAGTFLGKYPTIIKGALDTTKTLFLKRHKKERKERTNR